MAAATDLLKFKFLADLSDMKREMQKANSLTTKMKKQFTGLGATIAGAFAVREVATFGKELFELGEKARGVNSAFKQLPESVNLMKDLQAATAGTVGKLELMQTAVKAQNFNIPLNQLGTLLKFATIRAAETGESVDYLVDSIVTGIGRKSPLILDNLGISASKLSEEFKRTGDFGLAVGNIVKQQLGQASMTVEEAATNSAKLSAAWEDFKLTLSDFIVGPGTELLGFLAELIKKSGTAIQQWKDQARENFLQNRLKEVEDLKEKYAELGRVIFEEGASSPAGLKAAEAMSQIQAEIARVQEVIVKFQRESEESQKRINSNKKEELNTTRAIAAIETPDLLSGVGSGQVAVAAFEQQAAAMNKVVIAGLSLSETYKKIGVSGWQMVEATHQMGEVAINLGKIFQEFAATGLAAFGQALGDAISGVGNFGSTILAAVGGFMQQLGQMMIQTGILTETFKNILIANPLGAVAAGVALVAIGRMFANKANAMTKNMGSGGGSSGAAPSSGGSILGLSRDKQEFEITGTGRISGTDIVITYEKAKKQKGRTG